MNLTSVIDKLPFAARIGEFASKVAEGLPLAGAAAKLGLKSLPIVGGVIAACEAVPKMIAARGEWHQGKLNDEQLNQIVSAQLSHIGTSTLGAIVSLPAGEAERLALAQADTPERYQVETLRSEGDKVLKMLGSPYTSRDVVAYVADASKQVQAELGLGGGDVQLASAAPGEGKANADAAAAASPMDHALSQAKNNISGAPLPYLDASGATSLRPGAEVPGARGPHEARLA